MKKTMKQMLAALLAVAMVITGLYVVPTVAEKVQAEETESTGAIVEPGMLDVKVQNAIGTTKAVRLITSVNSLDYGAVGFEVQIGDATPKMYDLNTVYERIESRENDMTYTFSPKVVDTSSEYFATAKMYVEEDVRYTIRAYIIPFDSTTPVFGQSRTVEWEDGKATTYVNVSFKSENEVSGTIDNVTSTATTDKTSATVIGKKQNEDDSWSISVRVAVDNVDELPSATKFTFGELGSAIYRNLYTTHVPASGTTPIADTTWYSVYVAEGETKFTIASSADLYGFSKLSDDNRFDTDVIYLISDITVNNGNSSEESWAPKTGETVYEWTPISDTSAGSFTGTFDGQGHTISGLVCRATNSVSGLFGYIDHAPTGEPREYIGDFKIENSFLSSNSNVGSVAVGGRGNFDDIYSSANIVSTYTTSPATTVYCHIGGLIGYALTWNSNMTGCWFDGTITAKDGNIGGLVGTSIYEWSMVNCYSTARVNIDFNAVSYVGGFVGKKQSTSSKVLTIKNCINNSSINVEGEGAVVTDILGKNEGTTTISSTYTTRSQTSSEWVKGTSVTSGITYVVADNIKGYDGLSLSNLDFVCWTTRDNDIPALRKLVDDDKATLDTTWYNEERDIYYLSDKADLYGLAYLSQKSTFANKEIKLTDDIIVNKNTPDTITEWDTYVTENDMNEWAYPIGIASSRFLGTFNGQGHSISGVYMNATVTERALFGYLGSDGKVCNLSLENSYFASNKACVAGLVAVNYGDIVNVYSNACVKGNYAATSTTFAPTGGFVGISGGDASYEMLLSNCWFDGEVSSVGRGSSCMVAEVKIGTTTIENSLNTGKLMNEAVYAYAGLSCGGLVGDLLNNSSAKIIMQNVINAGDMSIATSYKSGSGSQSIGTAVGFFGYNAKKTVSNCYAVTSKMTYAGTENVDKGVGTTLITNLNDASLLGYDAMAQGAATGLDYTNDWALRDGKIPVPATLFELFCSDDTRLYPANAPQ